MKDYKQTIHLPQTEFPMKANLAQREKEQLNQWQSKNLYQKICEQNKNKPKFILHDGPPYANGHIHIGHVLNKVLKDIVNKSKTLSGFYTPFIPGWDCHGLPIEHVVEKKHGKANQAISSEHFRQYCREYAASQVEVQKQEMQRLGILADWDHPYLTMAPQFEADIIRSFAKIFAKGHVVQGNKPVHWCVECGSALAEAEVEYQDKSSPAIDVKFDLLDPEILTSKLSLPHSDNISIPIWTTTPWTLPANAAVSVHPEIVYAIVRYQIENQTQYLILADALVSACMTRYGINDYQKVADCLGKDLEGLKLQHPFYEKHVPIILGEHVTIDAGTGAVHTAPAHGQEDYVVAQKYHLPVKNPVDDRGCFLENVPLFAKQHVTKANQPIIETLTAKGKLLHAVMMNHSYPHCWRHKTPLIFRATPQWFISMDKNGLRRDAIDVAFKVQWVPELGLTRITSMVETRPDWCISRQRSWGVPLSLFIHKKTHHAHPDTIALLEKVAERVEKQGIEAWFKLDPKELGVDENEYFKSTDVLDVWFDSGVSHLAVLAKNKELTRPADLYLEGSDQHRGWFQSSLLSSVAVDKISPYRAVLTHGFTVDAQGRKMSKSLGNVIAPEQIIQASGADILRLWVASSDYRNEISISDEILKRITDSYRRIRNTARFLLANIDDFDPAKDCVAEKNMLALDRFIVDRARILQDEIIQAYDQYQYHVIFQKIHHFCSLELGAFYLDVIKDRQYTSAKNSRVRRSAQTAMYYIVEALVRWLAPILSFTAEEIWQYIPGKRSESVFLAEWFKLPIQLAENDPLGEKFWEYVLTVRDAVNKQIEIKRNEGVVGAPLEAEVKLFCNDEHFQKLQRIQSELHFVFITSKVELIKDAHDHKDQEIPGIKIEVQASQYEKCVRCWHREADVGKNPEYPGICLRCVTNITNENGEERKFA